MGAGRRFAMAWTQVGWPDGGATNEEVMFEPAGIGSRPNPRRATAQTRLTA